ncbi:hypothetical protein BH10ACT2_BH10ACT2_09480 [soil metagenome]
MVQSQLSAYSGSDPIWGFVALVGSEKFTGEAAVGLDPRVRLFAVDGHIYFAEREDDVAVATRLVNCGAITAMQLARGVVQAGGQESLARLFQRDATIDRDAVELTIETATETLLATIAHNLVGMPEVFPLRHHPAGLHHWLRDAPLTPVAHELAADEPASEQEAPVELPVVELPVVELAPFPAPKVSVEPAVPEWPKADDEPEWAVPSNASELPNISELVESFPVSITAAELPHLASLSSIQIQPTQANEPSVQPRVQLVVEPILPVVEPTLQPVAQGQPVSKSMPIAEAPPALTFDSPLPKLASGPMSVKDIKDDLQKAAATSESWSSPTNTMAAVQIWEMVDVLFDPPKAAAQVSSGGPPRGRGKRHKKG